MKIYQIDVDRTPKLRKALTKNYEDNKELRS